MDGVGFGFLTDFGQVPSLEDAYIVRTSPMNFDHPVRIVARNIFDFTRLVYTDFDSLFNLDTNSTFEEHEKLANYIASTKVINYMNDEHTEKQNIISARFQQCFNVKPISSIYNYYQTLKLEREQNIICPTTDSIGVVNYSVQSSVENSTLTTFNFLDDIDINIDGLKHFFQHANSISKLAFFRDATSKGLLYNNEHVIAYIKLELQKLNLFLEAERLSYPKQTPSAAPIVDNRGIAYFNYDN